MADIMFVGAMNPCPWWKTYWPKAGTKVDATYKKKLERNY